MSSDLDKRLLLAPEDDDDSESWTKTDKIAIVTSELIQNKQWSNQTVLGVTCLSFALFVIAEIIGALASGSLSLLGDAAAMSVDVFTYFTNMYAERVKEKTGTLTKSTKILLEIAIPSFSISALIGVTIYITVDAIDTLLNGAGGDDVNVFFLYGFSVANALVDIISGIMFYLKGKQVFYHTVEFIHDMDAEKQQKVEEEPRRKNLNMISALTHVGGDSLRTTSVFVAAVIATATSISSDACDSWAAIVVSITIIAVVIPLIREIYSACQELLFTK